MTTSGVTDISPLAFEGCSNLTSVTIVGTVTNIQEEAIESCPSMTSVFFTGNAPGAGSTVFTSDMNVTVYYLPGTTGWNAFLAYTGVAAVLRNPLIQIGDDGFGVGNYQFGFSVTGTSDIPIVVEACANLGQPVWTPLQSLTLANGSYYFAEPFQSNNAGRFYRISSP